MLQDLRFAVRVLLKHKFWTAVVVLSLALGIGANTALFSATNGLFLRRLPVDDPDSLVRLRAVGRNQMSNSMSEYGSVARENGEEARASMSYPMYEQLRKDNQTMTDLATGAPMGQVNAVVDGQAELVRAYIASGNMHAMLGVKATIGRTIVADDDRANATPVATISHQYWTRRFGADPGVIGKVIQANNTPITIVGVLEPKFMGIQTALAAEAPDLWFPIALDPQLNPQPNPPSPSGKETPLPPRLQQPTYWWLQMIGRLEPGVTAAQVQANLDGVFQETARQGMASFLSALPPDQRTNSQNANRTAVPRLGVSSAARGVYDNDQTTLRAVAVLSGVVGLILLLVCANVANLLLSRAATRQGELSIRLSIGATRKRIVRQLLTESLLLAFIGAGLGIAVAYWGKRLLPGQAGQVPIDWRVLVFTSAVALVTGILFGIAPALRATRGNANVALRETSRSVIGSRTLLGKSLLAVQVAISLVLLIGASLFLRTVDNLRRVDVGFNPQNLVVFRINPALNRYDAQRTLALYDQVSQRIQAVPGVRAVTLSNPPMLSGSVNGTNFVVQGRPYSPGSHNDINRVRVGPNFFETMEIPLLAGRAFTERDNQAGPRVGIINQAAVKKFFPEGSPIGQRFGSSPETSGQIEVVGVVGDVKYSALREPAPATMYVPFAQGGGGATAFVVRTAGDPAAAITGIREAVRQVDANVPIVDIQTQMDHIERRFSQERLFAIAYSLFGGLALLLAGIGLFGLMSFNVARRTNEIGIRMALGAERPAVLKMVMRESLILVVIGVAIGIAAALGAGRFVAALLFGLAPTDPTSMIVATVVLLAVSAFAGFLPARRASRVDPMMALRYE